MRINDRIPKISVITPSYNQGRFLEQTIHSVLAQGYPNLEYIVVDGGSTDETLRLLESYDDDLIWISERDRGQVHAINKGLDLASGDIIGFLNSDDQYEPGALWEVGKYFSAHNDCGWLSGKCRIIDLEGREIRRWITAYKNLWLSLKCPMALYILNFISQPATFWCQELFQLTGYFDETLNYAFDYECWLKFSKVWKPAFIDSYLACFRLYPNSKSGSTDYAQFAEQFQVARCYSDSGLLLGLHKIHNILTSLLYSFMRESPIG